MCYNNIKRQISTKEYDSIYNSKGGICMYYELSKREIKKFIKKYLNESDPYISLINHISRIDYNGVVEYRINYKYTLKVYK